MAGYKFTDVTIVFLNRTILNLQPVSLSQKSFNTYPAGKCLKLKTIQCQFINVHVIRCVLNF